MRRFESRIITRARNKTRLNVGEGRGSCGENSTPRVEPVVVVIGLRVAPAARAVFLLDRDRLGKPAEHAGQGRRERGHARGLAEQAGRGAEVLGPEAGPDQEEPEDYKQAPEAGGPKPVVGPELAHVPSMTA